MSFSLQKVIPQEVVAIGDDGKNRSSNLFDDSLETRWSYKGGFAYNIITLKEPTALDSMTIHWYMKKKERRQYKFGVYLSTDGISIAGDFDSTQNNIQKLYNMQDTIKSSNEDGRDSTVVQFGGKTAKTIVIIYTSSSSKKSWFSVKEIEILGRTASAASESHQGMKWDSILGDWKPIMEDLDEMTGDENKVMFWTDEVGSYLQEYHTFSRNFRTDGSMRFDIEPKDMGGVWRPDKEALIFLKVSGKDPKEEVSAKFDGGPHNDKHPKLGRCNIIGVSFDMKRLRFRQELYHEKYVERQEIDISSMALPAAIGNFYGFCFTDRRVLNPDGKIVGRIFGVKVNPNPFDWNRNVLNDNWIDIGAFLSSDNIIEGPVDPEQYVDTIRVDGQNSSTFGYRFLRYCQIEPIKVKDEEEMEKVFNEIREEFEEDAPSTDTNLGKVEADDMPKVITVLEEGEKIVLHAKIKPNPLITKVYWRQSSGKPVDLSIDMLNSSYVEFEYKKDYGTSEWTFTATAQGGVTVFERTIKIIDAIDPGKSKTFINPKYKHAREGFQYIVEKDHKVPVSQTYISDKGWKNIELTTVFAVGKDKTALPYVFRIGGYIYEIFPDGTYKQWGNIYPYMTNVPTFRGKKIGLKIVYMTTNLETAGKTEPVSVAEVYLNLEPDNKDWEYNPWFKSVQKPQDRHDINIAVPMDTTFDTIEIREIQPPSVIRNI